LVKIHKSDSVYLNSGKPVILDLPEIGADLRNRILKTEYELSAAEPSGETRSYNSGAEANQIIEQARQQAEQLIENAGKSSAAIRDQAFQDGYRAGLVQADRDREVWQGQMWQRLEVLNRQLTDESQRLFSELEGELLDLSLSIAEKVVNLELARNEKAFQTMVETAVSRLRQADQVSIRVSLDNYRCLLLNSSFIKPGSGQSIQLVQDESMNNGDCWIESSAGSLDNGVSSRLAKIRAELKEMQS